MRSTSYAYVVCKPYPHIVSHMLISRLLGKISTRVEMGLPSDWRRVEDWLSFSGPVAYVSQDEPKKKSSKWPDIPVLEDYSKPPSADFWAKFPFRPLPSRAETNINISELEKDCGGSILCMKYIV